jgi:hypothetical protein
MNDTREKLGWMNLIVILQNAERDEQIAAAAGASRFVKDMRKMASDAFRAESALEAQRVIYAGIVSINSTNMANKRHLPHYEMRAWILDQWAANKAKGQSKRDFGHKYVDKLFEKFGERKTARTITESWLKGM